MPHKAESILYVLVKNNFVGWRFTTQLMDVFYGETSVACGETSIPPKNV